jgi:hypothetical protein
MANISTSYLSEITFNDVKVRSQCMCIIQLFVWTLGLPSFPTHLDWNPSGFATTTSLFPSFRMAEFHFYWNYTATSVVQ